MAAERYRKKKKIEQQHMTRLLVDLRRDVSHRERERARRKGEGGEGRKWEKRESEGGGARRKGEGGRRKGEAGGGTRCDLGGRSQERCHVTCCCVQDPLAQLVYLSLFRWLRLRTS